jgi:hypothetical protein
MTELIDCDDVGVLETSGGARFGVETFQEIGVICKAGGQCFERDDSVDEGVAGLIDDAHGTLPNLLDDLEFAELLHRHRNTPIPKQTNPLEFKEQFQWHFALRTGGTA